MFNYGLYYMLKVYFQFFLLIDDFIRRRKKNIGRRKNLDVNLLIKDLISYRQLVVKFYKISKFLKKYLDIWGKLEI